MNEEVPAFRVFISHRFQDKAIADAVTGSLVDWGVPRRWIFQASNTNQGVRPSDDIDDALVEDIRRTDLFLLIFTDLDEDWTYCMWEVGVATGVDTKETRVVVLQCTDHRPRVRGGDKTVDLRSENDVLEFVTVFHRDQEFVVPDEGARADAASFLSFLGNAEDDLLQTRATALREKLIDALPNGQFRVHNRLDFIELLLNPESVREVKTLLDHSNGPVPQERKDQAKELLKARLTASDRSSGEALRRFGVAGSGESLENMLNTWSNDVASNRDWDQVPEEHLAWIEPLLDDVSRAVTRRLSKFNDHCMVHREQKDRALVQPVVTRTRERPDGSMEFDLYFFRIPGDVETK